MNRELYVLQTRDAAGTERGPELLHVSISIEDLGLRV